VGLINRGIKDGGVYSTRRFDLSRTVGRPKNIQVPWHIQDPNKHGGAILHGKWEPNLTPGFLPDSVRKPLHPSGNSLGYALQFANIFGASKVTLLGFSGVISGNYDWGDVNPAKKQVWKRDQRRIMAYLEWLEKARPGWARLEPGWTGPFYDVLQTREMDDVDCPW
jgi:hypothetical protein